MEKRRRMLARFMMNMQVRIARAEDVEDDGSRRPSRGRVHHERTFQNSIILTFETACNALHLGKHIVDVVAHIIARSFVASVR